MQEFRDYVISEYKVQGAKAIKFCFSHSANLKKGKSSQAPLIIDIITVKIKFVDENLNILLSPSLTFENNIIPKTKEKTLINISPKELNNKFAKAKPEICRVIMSEYMSKIAELNDKLSKLQHYCGSSMENIIPREFEGESIKIADTEESTNKNIMKRKFEM